MKHEKWQKAVLDAGELYLVGGMVRDLLMKPGAAKADLDYVVTGISPRELEEVLGKYGRVRFVGRSFGVYKFTPAGSNDPVDIAYPRREVSTGPGHRDFDVEWDWTLPIEIDLGRRDFTINAIAKRMRDGKIIDPFKGREDIKARVIRMIFPGAFEEDPLRILRGVRFAARFGFSIEEETRRGMQRSARMIAGLSPERIQEELNKLLSESDQPSKGFLLMHELDVLSVFFSELDVSYGVEQNEFHPDDIFMHSIKTCDFAPQENLVLRWAALLHDLGKVAKRSVVEDAKTGRKRVVFYHHEKESARICREVLGRLRYSKAFMDRCEKLIANHMFNYESRWKPSTVRRFINRVGRENLGDLLDLREADCKSRNLDVELQELEELRARVREELENQSALSLKDLAINGEDVMRELGIEAGPGVGRILREIFERVLEKPDLNDRKRLLKELKKMQPR